MMKLSTLNPFSSVRYVAVAAALGIATVANAQGLRMIDDIVVDDSVEYALWTMSISPNQRYVAGQAQGGVSGYTGVFVLDLETGKYVVEEGLDEFGGDLRAVSNTGVAVGYNPNGITLSIDGTRTELLTPDNHESGARDISADGSVVVGCFWSIEEFYPHACLWKDGTIVSLPEPTTDEMGFPVMGTSASWCNADASIIAGYIYDPLITFPLILWRLQDDGTYICDPICKDYLGKYEATSTKPYNLFRACNISSNGKYAALTVSSDSSETRMARMNLETSEIEAFVADGSGSIPAGTGSECMAVADDGTLVGVVLYSGSRSACIWTPGAKEPMVMSTAYPEVDDFVTFDIIGYHLLYDITPDAKVALGIAYDGNFKPQSYIIDFEAYPSGIRATTAAPMLKADEACFTLGGARIQSPAKGLNIVRRADGTVRKVLVK